MSNRDPLAELNEQFARFLQHADGLLREWKSAIDEQSADLHARVQREVDAQLGEQVRTSLARLRVEMDELTARRPGGPVAAVPQPEARSRSLIFGALASANVLLLIVVGLQIKACADRETGPAAGVAAPVAAVDAGVRVAPPPLPPDAAPASAVDAGAPDAAPAPKADPPAKGKAKPRRKKSSPKKTKSRKSRKSSELSTPNSPRPS